LKFPIFKIRSVTTEKKCNNLIYSKTKNDLYEETKSQESKITEEQDIKDSLNKIKDYSTKDLNYNNNIFKNSTNNNNEEKFTTDLSKNNLNTNNSNNNNITHLLGELNKSNQQTKSKRNFFVAIKVLEATASDKHIVFNYSHNDYYKNMINYKVRNDVNQLINAKNEKEMWKTLNNSGTQFNFFSLADKNINKEENDLFNTGNKFYNQSTKHIKKNEDFNSKRLSIEALAVNSSQYLANNLKKIILVNSTDSVNNEKNLTKNFLKIDKNNPKIKNIVLSCSEKKIEEFDLVEKSANDFKAFSSRKLSLEKISNNLNVYKQYNHNSNISIRNSINLPPESDTIINSFNKFKLLGNNNKNRSQESTPDNIILNHPYKTPFFKKNSSIRKISLIGLNNTNSQRNIRNVGFFSNTKENKKKKANTNNNFFKNNEMDRDPMTDTKYFDKHSNFNSTSNGFSTSEKNFRTTLESYLPRKNNNNHLNGNFYIYNFILIYKIKKKQTL